MNSIITSVATFILKYGFKYVATVFLMWSFIFIFIILLMGYISAWGAPKIPQFITIYLESNFPSNIKGTTTLKHNDLLYVFIQIALIFEIVNELFKIGLNKYFNLNKNNKNHENIGFLKKLETETKIILIVFSYSSLLLFVGDKLTMSIISKVLSVLILYALTLFFYKTYKTIDYAAENLR